MVRRFMSTPISIDKLWARYKENPTQQDRDDLIINYTPLVQSIASQVSAGLPQTVEQADLASYGMFGLIDAIAKFDPDLGFKFNTYATTRIKGAILDELRSIDWIPRSVRAKAKSVERATHRLETHLHRRPTDDELADELGLTLTQLATLYNQTSSLNTVTLDEMLYGDDGVSLSDNLTDNRDISGGFGYERVEMREMLTGSIDEMNERERIVLTLYYYENLTLAQIGSVLGVTESRVCQIHTKAVLYLRSGVV